MQADRRVSRSSARGSRVPMSDTSGANFEDLASLYGLWENVEAVSEAILSGFNVDRALNTRGAEIDLSPDEAELREHAYSLLEAWSVLEIAVHARYIRDSDCRPARMKAEAL